MHGDERTHESVAGHGMVDLLFFWSRRRHTSFDCDWSSDVCSSDLDRGHRRAQYFQIHERYVGAFDQGYDAERRGGVTDDLESGELGRSEERRVGKEC